MIAIYTITSGLHDEAAVKAVSDEFLAGVFPDGGFEMKGADFSDFGSAPLNLIYVRTGGAEGIFRNLLPGLLEKGVKAFAASESRMRPPHPLRHPHRRHRPTLRLAHLQHLGPRRPPIQTRPDPGAHSYGRAFG